MQKCDIFNLGLDFSLKLFEVTENLSEDDNKLWFKTKYDEMREM
jgi:hypothetical protein